MGLQCLYISQSLHLFIANLRQTRVCALSYDLQPCIFSNIATDRAQEHSLLLRRRR